MTDRIRWIFLIGTIAFGIAIIMQIPQVLRQANPEARGILVHLNSDEYAYLARVEEALSGRMDQVSEAVVGDPRIKGLQTGLIEELYGRLFGRTGWRAATVLQLMDSVIPPLIFLALCSFFILCGFTKRQALFGSLLFIAVLLYLLNRPVYQRTSFLFALTALMGTLMGLMRRPIMGVLGGVILGSLVGVYFWSWTFAWAWFGILFLWVSYRTFLQGDDQRAFRRMLLFGSVCVIIALPYFFETWQATQHPLYEISKFRSGIHSGRSVESFFYSICFLLMLTGVLGVTFTQGEKVRRYIPAVVTVITGFVVIHQQLIHGITFNFVSHYLFFLVMTAVMTLLLSTSLRSRWLILSFIGSVAYLAGVAYDGRHVLEQFNVQAGGFGEQHFSTLLPVLDEIPRARILSDTRTSMFIAGSSKHDVVYSVYLKDVLMTHEELAERLCLTLLPVLPEERNIAEMHPLIYPAPVRVYHDPSIREREVQLVENACARIDAEPAEALKAYDVHFILWDEMRHPEWNLDRLGLKIAPVTKGEGWSLWSL